MLKVFNHVVPVQSIRKAFFKNDVDFMIENIDAFAQFVSYENFRRHEGLSTFIYYREAKIRKKNKKNGQNLNVVLK